MRPSDQMSIFGVDFVCPASSSGAMKRKLPQLTFSILIPDIEPKMPKSTTLRSTESMISLPYWSYAGSSASITFWNFMSLWMILLLWQ